MVNKIIKLLKTAVCNQIICECNIGCIPKSSLKVQYRTAYKVVTDDPEPKTVGEILDRAGDHILLTEIVRGKFSYRT